MIYYIAHENIFKIIVKFCFVWSFISSNFPQWKFQNFSFPHFFSFLDFEKFQLPPDFVEFKNPVPPLHKEGGSHYG